jgi:hypothetical protein
MRTDIAHADREAFPTAGETDPESEDLDGIVDPVP